ncbi:hypothetical protein B6V72_14610 [Thioclava sp. F34-6]|nr:hypothetical protein B6V72_14610 [Thioclava sp. F34-6]
MTDLIYITLPFLGRIYAQRDTITLRQYAWEVLSSANGNEYLLSLGSLRVYLVPARVVAAERRPARR